ncbi:MAG: CoA transferase [Chloroflexi bacterium]|nr:CoA transferase [Chloroflexota bacterium]
MPDATTPKPLPLAGMKVLDFTQLIAGPYATMLLADMGADVTKVERPGAGDDSRRFLPAIGGESAAFMMVNRNKRSITLNLKNSRAREVFLKLAAQADVLVENNRPGTMAKLGVDYEAVKAINPGVIYCSISGFGHTGPYRDRGGYDLIAQAMGGMMSTTGEPDRPPVKISQPVLDLGTALFAVYGILTAYVVRQQTGEGQWIDTSVFETPVAFQVWEAAGYFGSGEVPKPMGSAHRLAAPYQAYRTGDDRYIVIATTNESLWSRCCDALGLEPLVGDPRFESNAKRAANKEALAAIIEERLATQPAQHWLDRLEAAGVPSGPVNTLDQVFTDPQVLARGMVAEVEHPKAGKVKTIGLNVKLSKTPGAIRFAAPTLGQHTEEILDSLGYSAGDLEALRREGAI